MHEPKGPNIEGVGPHEVSTYDPSVLQHTLNVLYCIIFKPSSELLKLNVYTIKDEDKIPNAFVTQMTHC